MLVDTQNKLMSNLLFTVHQHGGDDVTWKPPIHWIEIYPVDRDFNPVDSIIHLLNNWAQNEICQKPVRLGVSSWGRVKSLKKVRLTAESWELAALAIVMQIIVFSTNVAGISCHVEESPRSLQLFAYF